MTIQAPELLYKGKVRDTFPGEDSSELVVVASDRISVFDTKFEFGLDPFNGELTLGDEVLTPDSSRYVAVETYKVGQPPVSLDKQLVRDYYKREHPDWDRTAPAPPLPAELIAQTRNTYGDIAARRLTGRNPLE